MGTVYSYTIKDLLLDRMREAFVSSRVTLQVGHSKHITLRACARACVCVCVKRATERQMHCILRLFTVYDVCFLSHLNISVV